MAKNQVAPFFRTRCIVKLHIIRMYIDECFVKKIYFIAKAPVDDALAVCHATDFSRIITFKEFNETKNGRRTSMEVDQ